MSFIKDTRIYFVSNILNSLIPFIILPILTRQLSTEEYGQIAIFQTFLSGITSFVGLNVVGSSSRKFYEHNIKDSDIKEFNGSCFQILFTSTILVLFVVLSFSNDLTVMLGMSRQWIIYAVLVSSFMCIVNLRLGQWQVRKQAKKYGALQVFNSVINIVLSLFLVITLNFGAQGRIDGLIIAFSISSLFSIVLLYKDHLLKLLVFRWDYIKEALFFGIPLIPHTFGFFLINSLDRFVINDRLGTSSAGFYMVAVQLSTAMLITFNAINKAYVPWLFERLKRNNIEEKKDIVKMTYLYFIIVLLLACLGFYIGPYIVILIAGDKYSESAQAIGWLCLGQAFGGMYLMVTNYVFYSKKTGWLSLSTITTGVANVFLLFYFVDMYGISGAGMAFSISKLFQFLLTWYLASKRVDMPWLKFN